MSGGLGEAAKRNVGNEQNQIPDMAAFASSLSSTGFQKLPSGLIIQWGIVSGASNYTVTYPVTFPNRSLALFAVFATKVSGSTNEAYAISVNRHSTDVIVTWNARKADDVHILGIGKL